MRDVFIEEDYSLGESVLSDTLLYKEIDATINKWLNLQKIVKESQSLENIISQENEGKIEQMKKHINDFYDLKLKARKLYKDVKFIKLRIDWTFLSDEKGYYLAEAEGKNANYFGNAVTPLKNIIMVIRDNYDYIPMLVSLINEEDTKEEIESLAEFFCNQFYTNILIPNPEQEELLICIYKLLEYEINKMDIADANYFLDDSTFIGKLITAFTKQQEINNFIVNLLSKVFNEIDKRFNLLLELSLDDIIKYLKKNEHSRATFFANIPNPDEGEKILAKIPKTKINFKKQNVLEEEIFREIEFLDKDTLKKSTVYDEDSNLFFEEDDDNNNNEKIEINMDYFNELTKKILLQKIKSASTFDSKALYNHLINELDETYHNLNAFGNQIFFKTLNGKDFKEDKNQIVKMYLRNFLFIQEQVEKIIQSLIDKYATMPYALRCICTMINYLIKRKFPSLPKYFKNSFIGKFLFNKCIFPVLSLENANGLKRNLFSKNQANCLKCIISIISNANMCKLFDVYADVEKTMFNYYLLDIIPILNRFYDKLVDMEFPNQLNEFIKQSSNNINIREEIPFLFNDNRSSNNSETNIETEGKKETNTGEIKKEKYDYFGENSDEIIRIKSVCFNEKDIIFIINLLKRNLDAFQNLPNFKKIKMAMNEKEVKNLEETINKQKGKKKNSEYTSGIGYYTFFYDEDNNLIQDFKNMIKVDNKKGDKTLLSRIKNSIRIILRRLNLLNRKQYSYLNFAISNEKFFSLINYTLKDFESDNADDMKVPLNWHSQFIVNNLKLLDEKYTQKDFELLYEEIYKEENEFLFKLRTISPTINTREIMNLNCAENAVENLKFQTNNLEKTKKLEKIKVFIINDRTEVCVYLTDELRASSRIRRINSKNDNLKQERENSIGITTADNCLHKEEEKILYHIKGIIDFVYKFKRSEGNFGILKNFIIDDIIKGEPNHKISHFFEEYFSILNNKINVEYKYMIKKEDITNEILEKIEDHILHRIYQYIFPAEPLNEDISFYELTISYDWIPSKYFGVKFDLPLEAYKDSIKYFKEMEEKAFSISEKMKCYKMILINLNKINEFYRGDSGKSADDQTPIYTYIILKSHPKRLISNLNYITCFTDGRNGKDMSPVLFKNNTLISISKIKEITAESLNITEEEFKQRNSASFKRFPKP